MRKALLSFAFICAVMSAQAQETYRIPVSEKNEKMQTGRFEPTWQSLEQHPWLRIHPHSSLFPCKALCLHRA